jgi:hypothetical protein
MQSQATPEHSAAAVAPGNGFLTDEQEFQGLAQEWRRVTGHLSNTRLIRSHPAFLKIIGMGQRAVPILLRELRVNSDWDWCYALQIITQLNPAHTSAEYEDHRQAWGAWGQEKGLLD